MSHDVGAVADALLHEGYLLYPYQKSSLKNVHRYPMGALYPEAFCRAHDAGDASGAHLECIVVGPPAGGLTIQARFLQLHSDCGKVRVVSSPRDQLAALAESAVTTSFEFEGLRGALSIRAIEVADERWKLIIDLRNTTPLDSPENTTRADAVCRAFCSAHLLLTGDSVEFVSAIDPPRSEQLLVEGCSSVGLWPVLVGAPGSHAALLAAPIILPDHPELAPESPGDFFDGTEIDELLTLRVLTLTDEEKRAMAEGDARGREILERTEALGLERLAGLHGRLRKAPYLKPGARVRIHPKGRADIFDLALEGREATIQAIERDLEGRTHVAVSVEDDPGKDLGAYGHRFFFRPEDLEVL